MSKIQSLISVLVLFTMLPGCSDRKMEYDHDVAMRRVLKVQQLQNLNPGDPAVVPKMQLIVDSMRSSGRDACYFGAVNVVIDRLFSDGRYSEADSLAVRMQMEAAEGQDSIAMAMAKRVRAQIFFKLSQTDRAMEELKEAIPYIPTISATSEFGTATSNNEWLYIIAKSRRDTALMNDAGRRYADIVDDKNIAHLWSDTTGHYPVTALAFRAEEAMTKNDIKRASALLDSASSFIKPNLPARAYEHFYNSRAKVRAKEGNFTQALADVDTLLSTHSRYPWFYLQDLLMKADILNDSGQHEEATNAYSRYIAFHDSLSSTLTDRRLHDLTLLYRSEIDHEQKRIHTIRIYALAATIVLLLILFGVTLRHAVAERKRNRLLVERLHEYDRAGHTSLIDQTDKEVLEEQSSDIFKLDRFMQSERPYSDPGLGREELAEFMGMTQDALAQLIRKEKDCSVHSYINSFRLDEARRLLDADSAEPIADIASRVGFGTARTFQRAFKERFDMTPSQYRTATNEIRRSDNQ